MPGESPHASAATCGVTAATPLSGNGIAALRVGEEVSDLARECAILRDTTEVRQEGHPVRVVTFDLVRDSVEAEIVNDRVWRITVDRPVFLTVDSIGVGTPLERLLEHEGVSAAWGEGEVYAFDPAHCGLSFRLSHGAAQHTQWTAERLRQLPPETRVDRVLIVGCPEGADPP